MGWWSDLKNATWRAANWWENNVGQSPEEIRAYWHEHNGSLVQGTAVAFKEAKDAVRIATKDSNPLVTASSAIAISALQFAANLPLGLTDWAVSVAEKVPEGPAATVYKAVEVPVSGFLHGADYVGERVKGWADGSLADRPFFDQVDEVAGTVLTFAGLVWGAKSVASVIKPPTSSAPLLVPQTATATGPAISAGTTPPVAQVGLPGPGIVAPR